MDILDKIKNGNGRQIYNLMKQIRQRNEDGDTRKDLKTYWYACFERAKELNAQKYGNWEEAMAIQRAGRARSALVLSRAFRSTSSDSMSKLGCM